MGGGARPKSRLEILTLGSGINTGMATVGLMGSDIHGLNYTAFGREVNLASRLEAVSGRNRIVISEATYNHLLRDDSELAAEEESGSQVVALDEEEDAETLMDGDLDRAGFDHRENRYWLTVLAAGVLEAVSAVSFSAK